MIRIISLCALVLTVGSIGVWKVMSAPDRFGTFVGAPPATVAELIAAPESFLNKTVMIEGTVRQQCAAMGCFFYFFEGKRMLRVDLQDIAMNAPRRMGRPARVEGQITTYGEDYQFLASGVEFK